MFTLNLFKAELRAEDEALNLGRSAFLMARYLDQPFEIDGYLDDLADLAQSIRPALARASTPQEQINILNRLMFDELGFRGNEDNYYDPLNSLLHRVFDRRVGIPITLSAIYLEIGWQAGLDLWPIGMPSHFIVGYGPVDHALYIDPFGGGQVVTIEACIRLANMSRIAPHVFQGRYLQPLPKRKMLYRMLLNLKQITISTEAWEMAYHALTLMQIVAPKEYVNLRDRGLLAHRLGKRHESITTLRRYLFLAQKSPETAYLEQQVEGMEAELLRLN